MKLISWNVNGLRAVLSKGFKEYFDASNADIFCLQEIKLSPGQLELELEGYHCFYNYAEKKGYSGTAVFSRQKPLSVIYDPDTDCGFPVLNEGRVCCAEFDDFYVINVYVPNSQDGLARLPMRVEWDRAFRNFVHKCDLLKPVFICGDMNVAHTEIDIKNPKANIHNAGFTAQEREDFTMLLETGVADTFRLLYPDKRDAYSWWSYRFNSREKNIGWRIDYWLVSDRYRDRITAAGIETDVYGSDHAPVFIEAGV